MPPPGLAAETVAPALPAQAFPAAPPVVWDVVMLPVASLTASGSNPRKSMDAGALADLADSIRTHGVQTPLLVRYRTESATYQIVSGQRRHKAAFLAGLAEVPCMVREMTDREACEIEMIENLQREDLPPLEEADAYAALLTGLGTVGAIAARVGKPLEYVTRRLKLVNLLPLAREAFGARLLTLDHALLLAKLGAAEQEQALRYALDRCAGEKTTTAALLEEAGKRADDIHPGHPRYAGRYWEPASVPALKSYIEREIRLGLKAAPWDLADAELVASAGACTNCPKNTAYNTALFSDLAIEEASCSDSACFEAKRLAFVERGVAAAKAAGKDVVRVSWKHSSVKPKWARGGVNPEYGQPGERPYIDGGPDLTRVLLAGQWVEATKGSCAHARPGLSVDFDEYEAKNKPGMTLLVCVAAECKAHPKDWEKQARSNGNGARSGSGPGGSAGYDAKAEEARREQRRLAVDAENKLRLELARRAVEKTKKLSSVALHDLLAMALEGLETEFDVHALLPAIQSAVRAPMESALFAQAVVAMWLASAGLETNEYRGVEHQRKDFVTALKMLGVDASTAWEKPPKAAMPAAAKPVAGTRPAAKAVAQKKPVAKKAVKK
jgi:ParB/RepB/Spo0J family partition protein